MSAKRAKSRLVAVLAVSGLVILSGCSSSPGGSGSKSSNKTGSQEAQALLVPYEGHPTAFPVTAKLNKRPTGANVAVMDCGTSVCGLLWSVMESAGAAMGVHLIHYLAGPTTQQTASAFSAMLQTKPTAVIILPTSPLLIESDLLTLKADHIPVVTSGITWTSAQVKKYGIGAQQFALSWADTSAKLMAAWVVKTKGTSANVVIENVPDLEFGPAMTAEFKSEMKALCPTCQVSELDIPITTMGTTDTTQEVAYLEAHPNINVVASVSSETYYGVPSILSASNIHVDLIGNAPAPQNLIDIEQGTEAAGVGFDALTSVWTDVDAVARLLDGQPLSQDEITGVNDQQFLVKSDLSGDYSQGWTGYPDTPQRFESFWGVSS